MTFKQTAGRHYTPRAHDFLWVKSAQAVTEYAGLADWVLPFWSPDMPLIVRRDTGCKEAIPVELRGIARNQRQPLWIKRTQVEAVTTPVKVAQLAMTLKGQHAISTCAPLLSLLSLLQYNWPWSLGVTGSLAFSLVTGRSYLTLLSDLDLIIRCWQPSSKSLFYPLYHLASQMPVRVDIQIETRFGEFALSEWMNQQEILLKTDTGPQLTRQPWQPESADSQEGC